MPEPEKKPDVFTKAWWKHFAALNVPQFILWAALTLTTLLMNWLQGTNNPIPTPPTPVIPTYPDGWIPPTEEDRAVTLRVLQTGRFRDTEAGKEIMAGDADAPVWRLAIKGRSQAIPDRDQGQVGSCVSFGFAAAGEYTMAAQQAIGKQRQTLPDMVQEAIYAGSRVEANGGLPADMRGQDGSVGAWAAKWLESRGGYLARGTYGKWDLTGYDQRRCKQWGDAGVPDELEPEAKKHSAKCTLVANAKEAIVALSQGYAIAVCSNQGFAMERDAEGFARPQGSWSHCMCIAGYRADRSGFLIVNSWGSNWIKGPKGKFEDIPDGSFWADERTVDRMLKQQDSYAVANAQGFVRRKIPPEDWIVNSQPRRPKVFENVFALAP